MENRRSIETSSRNAMAARYNATLPRPQANVWFLAIDVHLSSNACVPHRKAVREQWIPRWKQQIGCRWNQSARLGRSPNWNAWLCIDSKELARHFEVHRIFGMLLDHIGHCLLSWIKTRKYLFNWLFDRIIYFPVARWWILSAANLHNSAMVETVGCLQCSGDHSENTAPFTDLHIHRMAAHQLERTLFLYQSIWYRMWSYWF